MRALEVISGPGAGQSVDVEGEVVIGRENADLTIADAEMSRRHAVVRATDDGVEIEDLGSLNGTFVNRKRIERASIGDGDELQVGKYRLTFLKR